MSIQTLIHHYGYAAVFVGALAEGESVLLAAGFAAHRAWLQLPLVMLVAFVAGTIGDQMCYFAGRRYGERLFARYPALARQAERVAPLLRRHPNMAVLGLRFLYGLRIAGPIALGALRLSVWRFVVLNMLGAAIWAALFATLGYQFGTALQWVFDDLRKFEELALVGLLLAGICWTLWRRQRR